MTFDYTINGYEDIDGPSKLNYYNKSILTEIKNRKNITLKDYIYYELAEVLLEQAITFDRMNDRKYPSN
ncbi:hypothetical protein [Paenibacillus castaneae]|uniref:hypothetical protein n=1 Tax=Paenibacillus castaneae TaxID=474957 RepID=UPI001ABA1823|nr:hypothetical protein [Paenibacillus castaneae]